MREVGQREDRDAEALRYGKALCKFLFVSFFSTRSNLVISFFSRESKSESNNLVFQPRKYRGNIHSLSMFDDFF